MPPGSYRLIDCQPVRPAGGYFDHMLQLRQCVVQNHSKSPSSSYLCNIQGCFGANRTTDVFGLGEMLRLNGITS